MGSTCHVNCYWVSVSSNRPNAHYLAHHLIQIEGPAEPSPPLLPTTVLLSASRRRLVITHSHSSSHRCPSSRSHRASPAATTRAPQPVAFVNGRPIAHGREARGGGGRRKGRGLLILRPPAVGAAAPEGPAAAGVRVRHVPGPSATSRRVPAACPASRVRRRRRLSPAAALRARGAVLRPGVPGRARYGGGLLGR